MERRRLEGFAWVGVADGLVEAGAELAVAAGDVLAAGVAAGALAGACAGALCWVLAVGVPRLAGAPLALVVELAGVVELEAC